MTIWYSLRRRLLLLLLGGASACWLATLAWSYVDAHHEIDELFDAKLAQAAQALLAQGGHHEPREHEHADDTEELEHAAHRYQSALKFQVWRDDGTLKLRSANAPTTPLAPVDGFSEARAADGHWRYYSQWDQRHHHRVQVAENHAVRDELVGHIAWRLLLPALFGLPLLGAWVWFATRRGLMPLAALARQVGERAPERLHAVTPAAAPEEVRPLLEALNDLFARVERTLANERRFTADAAHELRTPLAALAAQAQVAARARNAAERDHALAFLTAGMARTSRLVDQLLTLARLEPEPAAAAAAAVRLDSLAQEVCADHGPQALAKDIALELDAEPVTIAADENLLRILLRNLIDNAIRYTPTGGRVGVTVSGAGGKARLTVSDSGPGIPEGERSRVFERFARLAGQETDGSGLGLSIVRRIAELHGAQVTLETGNNGQGLAVVVTF
ncbi:MAG: ATP-binding protein [Rhodocyclaceae bacterium]|nr:ATP-binding protein [Rhodocyclaceae bacterium]